MTDSNCQGLCHLAHIPVKFGRFDHITHAHSFASSNYEIPANANRILNFNWAVYSFGGGHFLSTISSCNLPFYVTLACDQYEYGRVLFREFATSATVLGSSAELLAPRVTLSRFMAISFTPYDFETARRRQNFGKFRQPSLPNFDPSGIFK
jgi:hypothetical protein